MAAESGVQTDPGTESHPVPRRPLRDRLASPGLISAAVVGMMLAGLLVGYEPVGGDPDRIFRPIKAELARALREGRIPYWSDRFGPGIPLVAESHVAAFYPPNWLLYGVLSVTAAYRLAMWLHHAAMAIATCAYARRIGVGPWGAALAGVAFPLCGFLTIHSSHEWAYETLAYLPLALLAADLFAESGRARWLALLALIWGVQVTLGHFQVQMWTAGLVALTGGWRVVADRRPIWRLVALGLGLAWGGMIAAVQFVPTWELARLVGQTARDPAELSFYSYPPSHWAELAVPGLFRGLKGGPEAAYWLAEQTTAFEACLFVGTVPLILACVGAVGGGRGLTPWRLIVPASLALATMPRWWPEGYAWILRVPPLGFFRCPARYTAVASLGLCLLAGRGLDRAIAPGRFRLGIGLAVAFGLAAFAWAVALPSIRPELRRDLDDAALMTRLGLAAASWAVGLAAVLAWRGSKVGAWAPLVLTAAEVGAFYHLGGTTDWGWSVSLAKESPVFRRLAGDPSVRRIGGAVDNLPVAAGLAAGAPYTGFRLPPPTPMLVRVQDRRLAGDPAAWAWLRRYGVTHQVWDVASADAAGEVVYRGDDPALDALAYRPPGAPGRRTWRAVRLDGVFPEARVALRSAVAPDERGLIEALARADRDVAWYVAGSEPAGVDGPRARSARVARWDGLEGEVERDGVCDLVLTRAYYPGWKVRVGDGPEREASGADGGLLAVRLGPGPAPGRVAFRYRPNGAGAAAGVSLAAALAAVLVAVRPLLSNRARATEP